MKCFNLLNEALVGVYYITNFDEHDTYLYKYIHYDVKWQVAGPTWTSRVNWSDTEDLEEISPLSLLVLLGESPEEVVRRVTGQK